jgi:hypothetical protein
MRLAVLLLTGVLLSACASHSTPISGSPGVVTPPPQGYANYVVERGVTVRAAPFLGADEMGRLDANSRLTARLKPSSDNWTLLTLTDGRQGYVFGRPFRRVR